MCLQEKETGSCGNWKNLWTHIWARNSSCPSPLKSARIQSSIPRSLTCSKSRMSGFVCGTKDWNWNLVRWDFPTEVSVQHSRFYSQTSNFKCREVMVEEPNIWFACFPYLAYALMHISNPLWGTGVNLSQNSKPSLMKLLISEHPDSLSIGIATYCTSAETPLIQDDANELRFTVGGLWIQIPSFVFPAGWPYIRYLNFLSLEFLIWHATNYILLFKEMLWGLNEIHINYCDCSWHTANIEK